MPALWNMPRSAGLWDIQNQDQFAKYQVHLAEQSTKRIDFWSRWTKKYKKRRWEQNMGPVMEGIMAENSAIGTQRHTPRNITEVPLKTQVRHFERANTGRIKRHLWESPMFHFLPSFQDFRRNQIDFAAKDLDRQIAVGNDEFIRWQALQQCKYVWYCGGGSAQLERCVSGEGTDTTNPKDAAWFQAAAAKVGSAEAGFLSFLEIQAAASALQHQVGAPAWEGMLSGTPKDNEVTKGKFILTGDGLIYDALPYDSFVLATKKDGVDYLNTSFRGPVGDSINFLQEHFPLRYLSSATTLDTQFVAPEIEEVDPSNPNRYEKVPNPPYAGTAAPNTNCDIGIAFMEGYMPFEVYDVGPPPKEFASGSMSMKKYSTLKWNGEVRLTDDVLVNYGSNNLDTNKYGEYLQLIADATHGIVPLTSRHIMAVVFRLNFRPSLMARV